MKKDIAIEKLIDAFVDETDIGRVKVGQKAVFTVPKLRYHPA